MTVLLHLSDPHFGTERKEVCEALRRAVKELSPDALVVSGDITQRATQEQFAAAKAFFDQLTVLPCLVLPGNHDIPLFNLWVRATSPYRRFYQCFGSQSSLELDLPGVQITGVNTSRWWRQQRGAISPAQIQQVAHRLRQSAAGIWRIVVTHHPLIATRTRDIAQIPFGATHALQTWSSSGLDLVLGGHIHLPFVERVSMTRHPVWVSQAGTAVSSRIRDNIPNSFSVLRQTTHAGSVERRVERWDFAEDSEVFEKVSDHVL